MKPHPFLSNNWARIPFSVIGVFLLLGSSLTATFIISLEQKKSDEISSSLSINEFSPLLWYAEADLARALNYAACKAYDCIGKNPVVDIEPSVFSNDCSGDGRIDAVDVNLNRVRWLTSDEFNHTIQMNFKNNQFCTERYAVNIEGYGPPWTNIFISQILTMKMNRVFNHPIAVYQAGFNHSTYPVYPVFSTVVNLTIFDKVINSTVFKQTSTISTVITTRYLLLENLTNEFDKRLDGTFGSLGVSTLAAALSLTWTRGYLQYLRNRPLNIVSTDWLGVITNAGILFEEGFVFNSVDPLGVIYVGYETAQEIAKELHTSVDEHAELQHQIVQSVNQTNLENRYSDDALRIANESPLLNRTFNSTITIEQLCNSVYQKFLDADNCDILSTIIEKVYSATVSVFVTRNTTDNYALILQTLDDEQDSTKNIEQERLSDAEGKGYQVLGDGWIIDTVTCVQALVKDGTETHAPLELLNYQKIDSYPFNNSNRNYVIFEGEHGTCSFESIYSFTWSIETIWEITAHSNETTTTIQVILDSENPYRYDAEYTREDDVVYSIASDEYASVTSHRKNDILKPFTNISFMNGSEVRNDPNLGRAYQFFNNETSILELYKHHIVWDETFKMNVLVTYETGEYAQVMLPPNSEWQLYRTWLDAEIHHALLFLRDNISNVVRFTIPISAYSLPDEIEQNVSILKSLFINQKNNWSATLNKTFSMGDNLFYSAAAKVIWEILNEYLNSVEQNLESTCSSLRVDDAINTALQEATQGREAKNYSEIKQDATYAEQVQFAIPLGYSMNLAHMSESPFDTWNESFLCALTQKPRYFSHQTYQEYYNKTGMEYTLRYRNVNVFSPAAGMTDFITNGFSALNQQVLAGIDKGFDSLENLSGDLRETVQEALNTIADELIVDIRNCLGTAIAQAQGSTSYLTRMNLLNPDITESIVTQILSTYGSNDQLFIHDLNTSYLRDQIISRLQQHVCETAQSLYGSEEFFDDIIITAKHTVESQVLSIYDTIISQVITSSRDLLKEQYQIISEKVMTVLDQKIAELIGSIIPAGLPILPPFGWWCTLNIWYIEVEGEIPFFQVVDANNEAFAHPLFGHTAQEYIRTKRKIWVDFNNNSVEDPGEIVGWNTPVDFSFSTASFVIVPPGKTGVGDRAGGWDEHIQFPEEE